MVELMEYKNTPSVQAPELMAIDESTVYQILKHLQKFKEISNSTWDEAIKSTLSEWRLNKFEISQPYPYLEKCVCTPPSYVQRLGTCSVCNFPT